LKLGGDIGGWLEALPERVVFLSSGDESYCHGNSRCPTRADGMPNSHYLNPSYNEPQPGAVPFDAAVTEWLTTLSAEALHGRATEALPQALSCGFDGKILLHGMFGGTEGKDGDVSRWLPSCVYYGRPVYYVRSACVPIRLRSATLVCLACRRDQGMLTAVWTAAPSPPRLWPNHYIVNHRTT
jgi:hypothetical protein